jgi:CRISPR-associated protein Cas5t
MKVLRIHIKGWTASYRFSPFIMMQPTLGTPPLSAIYGIISSAAGRLVYPSETSVGYVAPFKAKARDLEKIYQIEKSGKIEKTNVIQRDFIFEPELCLYLTNLDFEDDFLNPRYPILLGRSCDLAFVKEVKPINLQPVKEATFQYTILPFPFEGVASPILALPIAFSDTIPRRPISVRPFHIIENEIPHVKGKNIFIDPEKRWGVYLHEGIC